jgi:hypothetical protein
MKHLQCIPCNATSVFYTMKMEPTEKFFKDAAEIYSVMESKMGVKGQSLSGQIKDGTIT